MNKLDALIDGMKQAEHGDVSALREACPDPVQLRRILEAAREDMAGDEASCINRQLAQLCANHLPRVGICEDCPLKHHDATRAVLEQVK